MFTTLIVASYYITVGPERPHCNYYYYTYLAKEVIYIYIYLGHLFFYIFIYTTAIGKPESQNNILCTWPIHSMFVQSLYFYNIIDKAYIFLFIKTKIILHF